MVSPPPTIPSSKPSPKTSSSPFITRPSPFACLASSVALFRLFLNLFPVLTSLNFAKGFSLCDVTDSEYNNNNNNCKRNINDIGLLADDTDKTAKINCFRQKKLQQQSDDKGDNLVNLCGQLKKLLDLPAVLFSIILIQLISFVLVLNIEECSPLVLFSWWRNKIS